MEAIQTVTTKKNFMGQTEERMPNGASISKATQRYGKKCCGTAYVERTD